MMNKFFKKLLGIDKIEAEVAEAIRVKAEADRAAEASLKRASDDVAIAEANAARQIAEANAAAKEAETNRLEAERLSKLSPKEVATAKKEAWVNVMSVNVNDQNPRNGFFELDWNEYFIIQLKAEGYLGETDEEIVDGWFGELCRNVGADTGVNMDRRGSGYINVQTLGNGKSEIS
jgi:hypothetical protein